MQRHLAFFDAHVAAYLNGDPDDRRLFLLKADHSKRVYEEALALTPVLDISDETARCVHAAALYHDLGRFPQYKRFKTFRDADSVNHARLGTAALRASDALAEFDRPSRNLILLAVALHNRRDLPRHIAEGRGRFRDASIAVKAVRDCDKLDIARIMIGHFAEAGGEDPVITLGLANEPDKMTQKIVDSVLSGCIVDYGLMRRVNDLRLLLLSWVFDLRFPASKEAFFARGFVDALVDGLPPGEVSDAVRDRVFLERGEQGSVYAGQSANRL